MIEDIIFWKDTFKEGKAEANIWFDVPELLHIIEEVEEKGLEVVGFRFNSTKIQMITRKIKNE